MHALVCRFKPCGVSNHACNVVSAPDPNQPQCGSLPVSPCVILDAICAGVGLGPRLHAMQLLTC